MGKILDINDRISNRKNKEKSKPKKKETNANELTDITEARAAAIASERRIVKRTILNDFVGAFAVIPERGLVKVTLSDVSDDGIGFDIPEDQGNFQVGEEVAMRVYLNHKTYFPFIIQVTNRRTFAKEDLEWRDRHGEMTVRHGASFVKGTINDVALHHFIKFIETVSASLKTDHGDIVVNQLY